MRYTRLAVLFVTLLLILSQADAGKKKTLKRSKRNHVTCRPRTLVRYKLTVHTLWSRQTFPKMYPTYRPHAQWSALVGRTHSPDYKMWEEGENCTFGVQVFAETGDQSFLDTESVQGYDSILDTFVAPPVIRGVGETSTVIILDGGHSVLSFMMRIIPSPDWFIGVSGLDLCSRGRWKKQLQTDLHPLDAGTDQGLTFSAPNWPTDPRLPISTITSTFPDHPASSFYYPDLKVLPRIAYVQLDLVAEYRHRRTFMDIRPHYNTTSTVEESEDADTTEVDKELALQPLSNTSDYRSLLDVDKSAKLDVQDSSSTYQASGPNVQVPEMKERTHLKEHGIQLDEQDKETQIPVAQAAAKPAFDKSTHKFQSEVPQEDHDMSFDKSAKNGRLGETVSTDRSYMETGGHPPRLGQNTQTERSDVEETSEEEDKTAKPIPVFQLRELMRGSASAGRKMNREVATSEPKMNISPRSFEEPQFLEVSTRFMDIEHEYSAIDCEVDEWSEWSPCTETCGFGKKERSRDVLKLPHNGGANCPRLRQEALCGSMRSCKWGHFDHFSLLSPRKRLREGKLRRRRIQ